MKKHRSIEQIKEFLDNFLTKIGVSFERVDIEDDGIGIPRLNIVSKEDSSLLIGPQGEHLQALNTVVKKITESKENEDSVSCIIDVNNYQKKQIDNLKNQAKIISERVKLFAKPIPLPAMTAYERMIVHAAVQEIEGVRTSSEGYGRERHIVILPN